MHQYLAIQQVLRAATFAAGLSIILCEPVSAHTMNMFAYVEAEKIQGEVFARGGSPIIGAAITAYGPDGETLGEAKSDDTGKFSLVPTKRCDWRLVAVTDDGHQAEYTVPAAELSPDLPDSGSKQAEPASAAADAEPASAPNSKAVVAAPPGEGTADLSRQIAALRLELNQFRERLRLQDLIGGIGYILGLMGLAFYFLGVQRRDRDQARPKV